MCGRSRCALAPEEVCSTAGVPPERWQQADAYQPDENVAPGHRTPVVCMADDGARELHTMKWGLVPGFSKPDAKPDHFKMVSVISGLMQISWDYDSCLQALQHNTARHQDALLELGAIHDPHDTKEL